MWNDIPTKTKGNIVSVSANNSMFIGVSDSGEIIKSTNATDWEIKDFNKEYAGYLEYSKFTKVLATQNNIVIIGTHEDGSPSVLFSAMGNVWSERFPIYYDENEKLHYLSNKPNGITYDADHNQFILACDNGELFFLPSCTKCNKKIKITEENLNALFYSDDNLYIVGDNFSVITQKL